jgi:hypothetical protein
MWLPAPDPEPKLLASRPSRSIVSVNPGVTRLRWTHLDDVAADGQPIGDRRAQLRDPRSREPSSDQLDRRSRTAATTLAS